MHLLFDALITSSSVSVYFNASRYADETRTTFKKPTRLECMMQDLPKLLVKELKGAAKVGAIFLFALVLTTASTDQFPFVLPPTRAVLSCYDIVPNFIYFVPRS